MTTFSVSRSSLLNRDRIDRDKEASPTVNDLRQLRNGKDF